MPTATAARLPDRASRQREGLRCRIRLADGRVFTGELAPARHRALQLGMLHEHSGGLVELAAGSRCDGRLHITTRRRADHFLPGGGAGQEGWLEAALELAERHDARGEEVFVAPAARSAPRGEKQAVSETRFLWVDVDRPGQLPALWAFLAERPCHLLIESGGSGGCHAYWRLAEPLPATHVVAATGELVEPIERANLRIIHRLGVGEDGRPSVADPACAERSRVMRLAGTINGKTGAHARIIEADFALAPLPDRAARRRPSRSGEPPSRLGRSTRAQRQIRTSGSARPSTSRSSPGSSSRATGSCPARRPSTRTATRRARSAPARIGLVLSLRELRGAGRDLRPRVGAARRAVGARAARRRVQPRPRIRRRRVRRAGRRPKRAGLWPGR